VDPGNVLFARNLDIKILYIKIDARSACLDSWRRLSSLLSRDSSRLFCTAVGFQMFKKKAEMNLGSAGLTACATGYPRQI
jgi:hypothetical protein